MLRIEVTSLSGENTVQPLGADFGELGGSIGRSDGNTLVLPDEKRQISRTHATITFRAGSYVLQDQGTATPTFVGGAAVGSGNEVTLRGDDEIRIGDYVLRATVQPPMPSSGAEGRADAANEASDKTVIISRKPAPVAVDLQETQPISAADAAAALAPPPTATNAVAPAVTRDQEDALLRAFLEGLAMPDLKVPGGMTPELMNSIGQIMREAMRGTIEMLLARAEMKREVRAEVTLIAVGKNNPLKFSPTVEVALTHLLTPPRQGFMNPVEAVRDACNDLRSHQYGFMAGMRAALERLITRFNPILVEQRLAQKRVFFTLSSRRARLWSLYKEIHREISQEADADFQTLFRQEFRRVYEEHIDKLEREDAATKR